MIEYAFITEREVDDTVSMTKPQQPTAAPQEAYDVALTQGIEAKLQEIDRFHEQIQVGRAAQPVVWQAALAKLKVRWTTDSNAIEGSQLSYGDTLFFLQEGLTQKGRSFKDYLAARNHSEAIEILFDAVADRRPVSTSLLKEINALIMLGVTETAAIDGEGRRVMKPARPGEFKAEANHVLLPDGGIHFYVDPLQVSGQMERLCDWIVQQEGKLHPAIVAAVAHYNMVRIHPFDDGNGRGARILMNLILMKAGYVPAVIENKDREDYLDAIRRADKGDLSAFVFFIAEAVARTEASLLDDLDGQATTQSG